MGSPQLEPPGDAPQQELPAPVTTRSAACPYFSFTTSWMFCVLIRVLLFADLNDLLRFDSLAAAATLRVQEAEQLLQAFRIGHIAQEGAFPPYGDQFFVFQLIQMMR